MQRSLKLIYSKVERDAIVINYLETLHFIEEIRKVNAYSYQIYLSCIDRPLMLYSSTLKTYDNAGFGTAESFNTLEELREHISKFLDKEPI